MPSSFDDVGALYDALARRLEWIVRRDVGASEQVIEDACQFAWSRLVVHHRRVRCETAFAWLARTAVHEAVKLVRRSGREPSLEGLLEQGGDFVTSQAGRSPEAMAEARERLAEVSSLAPRRQRLLWLHAVGLSYEEIARHDGCTARTVERQLSRARTELRSREGA